MRRKGRKAVVAEFEVPSRYLSGGTEGKRQILSQGHPFPRRDLNPVSLEYEGVLPTRLPYLVTAYFIMLTNTSEINRIFTVSRRTGDIQQLHPFSLTLLKSFAKKMRKKSWFAFRILVMPLLIEPIPQSN
jgi:hypothetical protein